MTRLRVAEKRSDLNESQTLENVTENAGGKQAGTDRNELTEHVLR